jgi:hypothetical protein
MNRLWRRNTLIEDNLYPLAGCHPPEVKAKFADSLEPIKEDIIQIEAALLLHNIRLFVVVVVFVVAFLSLSLVLSSVLSPLAWAAIVVPLATLVYNFGGVGLARSFYFKLPDSAYNGPARVRSLDEILDFAWFPLLWGWRIAFFVYRTYVCPNGVDAVVLIVAVVLIALVGKIINFLAILLAIAIVLLITPAVLTRTPLGTWAAQHIEGLRKKKEQGDQ